MIDQPNRPETWRVWSGRDPKMNVREMLERQLGKERQWQPLLIYREPVNGPRRITGFAGLATPNCLGSAAPLAEARLFYPDGMLHLVAHGGETCWAVWVEGKQEPRWFKVHGEGDPPAELVTVRDEKVLLRTRPGNNAVRTGLGEAVVGKQQLTVRLYCEAGVLQWWRLTIDG
ncbi:MAG: hypothetical protein ACQESR_19205 [Planctomycetota bacterium]